MDKKLVGAGTIVAGTGAVAGSAALINDTANDLSNRILQASNGHYPNITPEHPLPPAGPERQDFFVDNANSVTNNSLAEAAAAFLLLGLGAFGIAKGASIAKNGTAEAKAREAAKSAKGNPVDAEHQQMISGASAKVTTTDPKLTKGAPQAKAVAKTGHSI